MKVNRSWVKRRWLNFRHGHSFYLAFLLSLSNFLVITYTFLVSKVPVLGSVFPSIVHFAVVSLFVYVPLAVLVGHLHKKKQLAVDGRMTYAVVLDELEEVKRELKEIKKGLVKP